MINAHEFQLRMLRRGHFLTRYTQQAIEEITARIDSRITRISNPKQFSQNDQIVRSTAYNMLTEEGEDYYAEQYWEVIRPHLNTNSPEPQVLDLGCGQGRLAFRAANEFPSGTITGIDLSPSAIASATEFSATEGITNAVFICAEITNAINSMEKESFDLILMNEVSFYFPAWQNALPDIISRLRPGGLFIGSFRSLYFNVMLLCSLGEFRAAVDVTRRREGCLSMMSDVAFSWNTSAEIRDILRSNGLEVLAESGIGVCSGIEGDPHAKLARPGQLAPSAQEQLMEVELTLGPQVPDAGRYMLFIAKKNPNTSIPQQSIRC